MKEENNQDYHKFFISCRDGKINNVKKYFNQKFINGIKVNGKCYENPLLISASYKQKKIFDYLLLQGADINICLNDDRDYLMPLISKIIKYQFDIISNEYFQTDEGFEETDEDVIEKVITELLANELYYINFLIKYNVNINAFSEEEGNTVLDTSYIYRHKPAYKILQENGALHSKKFLEEYHNKLTEWEELYKNKQYVETTYIVKNNIPILHQVIIKDVENLKKYNIPFELDFFKSFIKEDININEKDYLGRTALDYAIELGHHLAVDYLRSVGGRTSKELEENNE